MITCDQHDYIEIACTFKFSVLLKLINEEELIGEAKDTLYNEDKEQCIVITTANDGMEGIKNRVVPLNNLKSMTALTKNPHFDSVDFS